MRMRLPLLILLIATAFVATAPAASAASCGSSQRLGAFSIKTTKTSCRAARTVISQWNTKCRKNPTRRCRLASGYTCRYSFDGYESATIRCTKGTKRVTWKR